MPFAQIFAILVAVPAHSSHSQKMSPKCGVMLCGRGAGQLIGNAAAAVAAFAAVRSENVLTGSQVSTNGKGSGFPRSWALCAEVVDDFSMGNRFARLDK